MSEKKSRSSDARPKSLRSWSVDSYIRSVKKRSRGPRHDATPRADVDAPDEQGVRSTSCPQRRRERKCSCSAIGDTDVDAVCRKALARRSLRQKFQDAVGQCLPLRGHHHHHHHQGVSSRPLSVLLCSKRKVHVSQLLEDKCPFTSKSELARCWHLLGKHGSHRRLSSSPSSFISWEEVSSGGASSPGTWDEPLSPGTPRCPDHTELLLVPDLLQISSSPCYWGVLDRFEAERLLEGQPEGTFLLRDSAQDDFLYSVSFRRYGRSLHARIEQSGRRFSFDCRDPCMYRHASVTGLLRHYADPSTCLFFEPLLSRPLPRNFPFSLQRLCRALICSHVTYQDVDALPLPQTLREYLRRYHFKCDGACEV